MNTLQQTVLQLLENSPDSLASALINAGLYTSALPETGSVKRRQRKYALPKSHAAIPPAHESLAVTRSLENSSPFVPVDTQLKAAPLLGYLRLKQIIGDPRAIPPIPPLVPVCRAEWWRGIQEGRFPSGIKLSPRVTLWKTSDILKLLESIGGEKQ